MSTVIAPGHAGLALAHRIAEHLPHRDGRAWTAAAYSAWWTTRPAARLTQTGRAGAVIVAVHAWRTEVAFQLDGREPYGPDVVTDRLAPQSIAREILRLVLPRLDDATALAQAPAPAGAAPVRLAHLGLIGAALRAHGAEPAERRGPLVHSNSLVWQSGSGVGYRATLVGANPAVDLALSGPIREVGAVLPLFLDEPAKLPRRVRGVKTALGRRLAAHLTQFTTADRLDDGGLSIGTASGPFGYVAPPSDPGASVGDSSSVVAELHGVGIDHLIALAPLLAR
ncbi:hypothetical protein [Streptomyces sp. NRRL B-24572]|uniref:hypothetical protein n=1 Tax=Streptomyces sp. NRRL B-24572 TaxID=1962156 RepID=UPI000A3BA273|nr:hypothetical protein [Streptomyces sp. NRRL B-24572]